MVALAARDRYQQLHVESAGKNQLVLMLYEGAIRFLWEARQHMAAAEHEAQSAAITRAQRILTELTCALDLEVGGDLARSLQALNAHLHRRLTEANVRSDLVGITEVSDVLADLLEAWKEADRRCRASAPARMCA